MLKSERRRAEFDDFATRAHRLRSPARSSNPSRAGTLYGGRRLFFDDSAAFRCAPVEADQLPGRLRRLHYSKRPLRTSTMRSFAPDIRPLHERRLRLSNTTTTDGAILRHARSVEARDDRLHEDLVSAGPPRHNLMKYTCSLEPKQSANETKP